MRDGRPILLFGAGGQVGSALTERLSALGRVVVADRETADFTQPASVSSLVLRVSPRIVVNAAAYTGVDAAESDESTARLVNAEAPRAIAEAARATDSVLLHFSTDYVYDGRKRTPYLETDSTNPLGVYGRTKLAGDEAIQGAGVRHIIVRTSWVYARHGRNFVNAILKRARDGGRLRVVNDQVGAPTSADAIGAACVALLEQESFESGVYHMSAAGQTTWFDFARHIVEQAGVTAEVEPISTIEFGAPAPRPAYSVLDNTKLAGAFGVRLPHWAEQLAGTLT